MFWFDREQKRRRLLKRLSDIKETKAFALVRNDFKSFEYLSKQEVKIAKKLGRMKCGFTF